MDSISGNKVVVFDSAPEDAEYEDRLILWFRDGEWQRDDWHGGRRHTTILSQFEADELLDMVGAP